MQDLMSRMIDVPLARMFVLAAILFLLLAVLGRIEGKIEPGNAGRIGATLLGVILMFVGLAMHFSETDALRDKMRVSPGQSQYAPARHPGDAPADNMVRLAMASPAGVIAVDKPNTKLEGVKSSVKVVTGTYGGNCGAKPGNVTAQVARACDGQPLCDYRIDPVAPEDAASNCAGNFSAEWRCGDGGAVYAVTLPAGAVPGGPLRLVCTAQ